MKTHPALQHRQAPSGARRLILSLALALAAALPVSAPHALSENTGAQESLTSLMSGMGASEVRPDRIKDLMNFNKCLKYKVGMGMHFCKGWFGIKIPSPCVKFTYNEPTNVNEVTPDHKGKYLKNGIGLMDIFFSGRGKTEEKKGYRALKTAHGQYAHQYDEARVYYVTPISRYLSSATPVQATQSLTCGLFGLGNMFQGFSLSNLSLGQLLNPANWIQNIADALGSLWNSFKMPLVAETEGHFKLADFGQQEGMIGGRPAAYGVGNGGLYRMQEHIVNLEELLGSYSPATMELWFSYAIKGIMAQIKSDIKTMQDNGPALGGRMEAVVNGNGTLTGQDAPALDKVGKAMQRLGSNLGELGVMLGKNDLLSTGSGFTGAGEAALSLSRGLARGNLSADEAASLASSVYTSLQYGFSTALEGSLTPTDPSATAPATAEEAANKIVQTDASPYGRWATPMLGSNFGQAKGGLRPVKAMLNGAGQQAYIEDAASWYQLIAELQLVTVNGNEAFKNMAPSSAANLCSARYHLEMNQGAAETLIVALNDTEEPVQTVPASTYLNGHHRQVSPPDQPNAACPLTHAGFTPVGDGQKVRLQNCQMVCVPAPGENAMQCRILPRKGFGGSCFTNPLSTAVIGANGVLEDAATIRRSGSPQYPACNGQLPTEVADGRGGTLVRAAHYDATLDHRGRLDGQLNRRYLQALQTLVPQLQGLRTKVDAEITRRGGSCDELGNPVGEWAREAELRRPVSNQYAQQQTIMYANDGAKVAFDNFVEFPHLLDPKLTITKPGVIWHGFGEGDPRFMDSQQLAAFETQKKALDAYVEKFKAKLPQNQFSKYLDGMDKVAKDLKTAQKAVAQVGVMPQVSRFGNTNDSITAGLGAVNANLTLTMAAGMPGDFVGRVGCFPLAGGAIKTPSLASNPLDIGCWGPAYPLTGYGVGNDPAKNMEVVGEKARRIATLTSAIQGPNSNDHNDGQPLVNRDAPLAHTDNQMLKTFFPIGSAQAGRHKGTGCYPVGTPDVRYFNPGESMLPVTEMLSSAVGSLNPLTATAQYDPGYRLNTNWKGTQCCVPIFCPTNVRRDY